MLNKVLKYRGQVKLYENIHGSKEVDFKKIPVFNETLKTFTLEYLQNKDMEIGVLYDPDVDGLMSGMVVYDTFKRLNKEVHCTINSGKRHGVVDEVVDWAIEKELDVLFVVDAGSGDKENILKLSENGIRVIVLDHHPYEQWETPENVDIINVQDHAELPKLSGCGVTFRFMEQFGKQFELEMGIYEKYVGITVISDVCDMTVAENRYYVSVLYEYFDKFRDEDKLFKQFKYYGSKKSFFGWTLIPFFNGLIRIGQEHTAVDLVNNLDSWRAMNSIKNKVIAVKSAQNTLIEQVLESSKIVELEHTVIATRVEHKDLSTLNGLVANKLLDKYGKNAMVLYGDSENKQFKGSLRGITYGKSDLNEFGLTARGHEHACGIMGSPEMFKKFMQEFVDTKKELENVERFDIEVDVHTVSDEKLVEIANFNEFAFNGSGIEPIVMKLLGLEKGVHTISSYPTRREYRTGNIHFIEFGKQDLDSEFVNEFDITLAKYRPYYQIIHKN